MPSSAQSVATQVVFDYLLDSQGRPLANRLVTVTLDYSFATNTSPVVFLLPITATAITDNNGYWQLSLVPNANINPSGTVYSIEAAGQAQYQISVPAAGGPFQSSAIVANATVTLSPAITGLTGPITVTGDETVTGNLTVQGNTSLAATQVAGDLTIASAFRLLFLAAASKLVPGATSFSIRNNADSADNLLVTNAGAATVRNGLTVTAGGLTVSAGDAVVTAGRLLVSAAAAKILGGATSLSLRNNADSADNLLLTDAGNATFRGTVTTSTTNFHAEVYNANAQSISNNTTTTIAHDTIEGDPNNNFNVTTHVYTCPVPGRYLVLGSISVAGTGSTGQLSMVLKNGGEFRRTVQGATNNTGNLVGLPVSGIVRCVAGDTLATGYNGPGPTTTNPGASFTYASFTYLGPN